MDQKDNNFQTFQEQEKDQDPSILLPNLTAHALHLISSHALTSPFFPHYFIPHVKINLDGHPSTGLQTLLSVYQQLILDNPNLKFEVWDSSMHTKENVAWVTCYVTGKDFGDGMSKDGSVLGKWILTDEGWRCGEWSCVCGMAPPF